MASGNSPGGNEENHVTLYCGWRLEFSVLWKTSRSAIH